ncbi:MAG: repair protein RecO [Verrucomicrobiota bacterium]|jgi:DNA repair protein RecO (recombination protein O)
MWGVWESAHGIILRLTKLTDTSLIVRWSTREHGLIETVAKGARSPKSRFAGKLDLFFAADLDWQRSSKGSLHHLRECSVTDFREGLRRDYNTMLLAGYCCGLFEQISEAEHAQEEMHDLLHRALIHLSEKGASLKAMRHFERELARLHGVGRDRGEAYTDLAHLGASLPQCRNQLQQRLRECP